MNPHPSDPATLERFRPGEKIALILEILRAYVAMWQVLRLSDVLQMAARARQVPTRERVAGPLEHQVARRLGKVVGKTLAVLPTDSRCLIRSLVLVRLLARRSIPSTLVIGVRKNSEFEAHAWVEHNGEAILSPGAYTRLTEL
ncbi:MAG TPA: lasso peptide biosynthesis B2 protein [Gemmatimonadota bacterium]|nr:lasso peptide biosynthesis B2 protein [Gemmatimonadota bacterium]